MISILTCRKETQFFLLPVGVCDLAMALLEELKVFYDSSPFPFHRSFLIDDTVCSSLVLLCISSLHSLIYEREQSKCPFPNFSQV